VAFARTCGGNLGEITRIIMIKYEIRKLNSDDWQKSLDSSSFYTPFHTPEWAMVVKDSFGIETIAIEITGSDGSMTLVVAQIRNWGPFEMSSSPIRGILAQYTGPVPIKGDMCSAVSAYEWWSTQHRKQLFTELWTYPDTDLAKYAGKFQLERHFSLRLDLRDGLEEVWKRMNKSVRKTIRRGEKLNIEFERVSDAGDWADEFVRLSSILYKRLNRKSLITRVFLEKVCEFLIPVNLGQIVICRIDDKIASMIFYLKSNNYVYASAIASNDELRHFSPQTLLHGKILKDLVKNGEDYYDLCGRGNDNIEYYKRSLGGLEADYWRAHYIRPGIPQMALKTYTSVIPIIRHASLILSGRKEERNANIDEK